MGLIRVLIVDKRPLVCEGIRTMLATADDIEVVGEASDGAEALAWAAEHDVDVVLLDLDMSNLEGLETTRRIKNQHPKSVVLMLTAYDGDARVVDSLEAGASGYLLKDVSRDLLIYTIRAASSGGTLIKTSVLQEAIAGLLSANGRRHLSPTPDGHVCERLTRRELEVLELVAEGLTNKEIARALCIAEDTAKKHVQAIIAKLGASDRTHAVMLAARVGLIT